LPPHREYNIVSYKNNISNGIEKAAREAGAKVLYVNKVSPKLYKKISIPGASFLKETSVIRHLECDTFINVPVAKNHSLAVLTIGMKNLMGITGDNRSKWHWDLHNAISDINRGVKSDLTIIDATNIMVRGGPTGGSRSYLKDLDTVIAARNVFEGDVEAAKLFGFTPDDIEYLKLGAKKGVGRLEGYRINRVYM